MKKSPSHHLLVAGIFVLTAFGLSGWALTAADSALAQTSWPANTLFAVDFVGANQGWAVGDAGTIIHTTDGGASWSSQTSGTGSSLRGVDFVDANHGWAVGDGGAILATSDGGVNWAAQASGKTDTLNCVAFTDATHGVIVGDSALDTTMLITTDAGANWLAGRPDVQRGTDLSAVCFPDTLHGWYVGWFPYFQPGGQIGATTDGGSDWAGQTPPGLLDPLRDVFFADVTHGWIVGGGWFNLGSRILATTDGGSSWGVQASWPADVLNSVAFADASRGWAVGSVTAGGSSGAILATSDGGTSWTRQDSGVGLALNAIAVVDATHACAVGDGGVVVTTTNGGATWAVRAGFPLPASAVTGNESMWGWFNHSLTLTIQATAQAPATSITSVSYALDGGSTAVVPAALCSVDITANAATHADDRSYALAYGATDNLGHSIDQSLVLGIDTRNPSTRAPYAAKATHGKYGTIRCKVVDPVPNGGVALVTIKVKNRAGSVVCHCASWHPVNKLLTVKFGISRNVKRGTYRFFVYAKDAAGNTQSKVGANKLVVK